MKWKEKLSLMRKPEIISYKGVDILYLNFENLKKTESIIALDSAGAEYIRKQKINSVLALSNLQNMHFNNEIRNHFIEVEKDNGPFIKATAVYGLNGLITFMFEDFLKKTKRNINVFDTRKEALRYLSSFVARPVFVNKK